MRPRRRGVSVLFPSRSYLIPFPFVYLFHRSLPHLIAQSKQLLALFERLWTKIHQNKCRDVSRRRNVTQGEMKKGNKRYTKRMSLPLSVRTVRTVFFYALHTWIQTHNPHISETQLCFKEFISLKAWEEIRYFFSGLLKKTYNPVRPEGFQSFLGKKKYIISIFFFCLSARLFLHIHVCLTINY